jgi:hypothetical protein
VTPALIYSFAFVGFDDAHVYHPPTPHADAIRLEAGALGFLFGPLFLAFPSLMHTPTQPHAHDHAQHASIYIQINVTV